MGEVKHTEAAKRAVQELGALLSMKPHSRDPNLRSHYFEWVQRVERAHADIRDALDRSDAKVESSHGA